MATGISAFPTQYFGTKQNSLPTERDIAHMRHSFKRHIIRYIEKLPHSARVLDLGCGAGKTIRIIMALRPDVQISGIDISDLSERIPKGVSFTQGPLEQLNDFYAPDTFDAVICQHVIEHLVYPLELLSGIKKILKPGGTCFVETPNWTRLFVPFSNVYFWNDYTHIRPFSRGAMHRLFDEYDMRIDQIITTSSSKWFPVPQPKFIVANSESHDIIHKIPPRGPLARIAARLINPLLRDILIGIATRPER